MSYPADPGNVFASDYHRRVMGHLPGPDEDPTTIDNLYHRMLPDGDTTLDGAGLEVIVAELQQEGDVEALEGGYRRTSTGSDRLTGPALVRREVPKSEGGGVEVVFEEDPPKEGKDLERAEEVNEERAEQDRQIEADNKARRKEELKAQLAALEEE